MNDKKTILNSISQFFVTTKGCHTFHLYPGALEYFYDLVLYISKEAGKIVTKVNYSKSGYDTSTNDIFIKPNYELSNLSSLLDDVPNGSIILINNFNTDITITTGNNYNYIFNHIINNKGLIIFLFKNLSEYPITSIQNNALDIKFTFMETHNGLIINDPYGIRRLNKDSIYREIKLKAILQ